MNIEYYKIENYYLVVVNKGLAFNFLPDSYTFILLNKSNFDKISSHEEEKNKEIFGELGFYLDKDKNKIDVYRGNLNDINKYVIGICQITLSKKNINSYNIRQMIVKKGSYVGKLFYDTVFSYIKKLNPLNVLTSDREIVSPYAKERWKKIFNSDEYQKIKVDNYNNPDFPKTPEKIDDEYGIYKKSDASALSKNNIFLNYLYRIINSITFKDVKLNDMQEMVINKIINNDFIIKTIIKSLYKTYGL